MDDLIQQECMIETQLKTYQNQVRVGLIIILHVFLYALLNFYVSVCPIYMYLF